MRLRPQGLRARSAAAFAMLALLLSVTLSVGTYQLARWYLLEQRETLATRQAIIDALVAKGVVKASEPGNIDVLESLRSVSNARAVLRVGDTWYAAVVELSEATIPAGLVRAVDTDGAAKQRIEVNNTPYLVVGVLLPGVDAAYFEFVPITEYRRTLETLAAVLIVGASLTTIGGAVAGWLASRRLMRPLGDVALAAQAMSAGDLTRRLEVGHDRDLEPVAESFNEMAESLEARIDRELRFTADVSHELRTPLTAMASAVSLARRSEMSGRVKFAVDVLHDQVDHLRRLTLELLEISRIDAGVSELRLDDVDVEVATCQALMSADIDVAKMRSWLDGDVMHRLDRTRYDRVLANLLENADRYGGGVSAVELLRRDGDLVIWVDDAGPGVDPAERTAIFGRFHRGSVEQPPDRPKGTGLGLALVDEHVRMHGGTASVTDSPWGGARFVVHLPRSA
jgi:two-component system, OmpR family, sensor histidine kinase MtrB